MKPGKRTPQFYLYTFLIALLFSAPWITIAFALLVKNVRGFDKYTAWLVIALVVLVYELIHTFDTPQ